MKKLTAEWVRKAEADMTAATALAKHKPPVNDAVCFHSQQATEKYLKALLEEFGDPIPKIHDLEHLIDLLLPHDATLRKLRRGFGQLSQYAVEYRYPGLRATKRQTQSALRKARRVRVEIRKRLGLDKRPKRRKRTS